MDFTFEIIEKLEGGGFNRTTVTGLTRSVADTIINGLKSGGGIVVSRKAVSTIEELDASPRLKAPGDERGNGSPPA